MSAFIHQLTKIRDRVSFSIARRSFYFFEKYFGLHLTPANFYSPIPFVSKLKPRVFDKVYECTGLNWNLEEQLCHLREVFPKYIGEFIPEQNSGLSLVDAFVLYAMIREYKPKMMVEVGSGDTTKISLEALRRNRDEGHHFRFLAVEPFPRDDLRALRDPDFELVVKVVQEVDLELLSEADLLFIDSSHVSKIDSDVNYEMLEVIPRLKAGAVIHWHDITIPTNYWQDWVQHGKIFWNESFMVHTFMLFNDAFRVLWGARYMGLSHFEELRARFPYLTPQHRLMSFWIQRN